MRVLILGTGAGLFSMFFKSQLKENLKELITVDISQEIVEVGKKHFGFKEDEVVKSVIGDAYQYVEDESKKEGLEKFDLIIMDINY